MKLVFLYSDEYAERVIGNLINYSDFCGSCNVYGLNLYCQRCRYIYNSFAEYIEGSFDISKDIPPFSDNPEKYLPRKIPRCDIIVAIALHPDVLSIMPDVAVSIGARGLIVPIEEPNWVPMGLKKQVFEESMEKGVACTFPKPFCSLDTGEHPLFDGFIEVFKIGKPLLDIDVRGDVVYNATVIRSSPCGSTWYVAQKMRLKKLGEIPEVVSKAHHAYPCTASMEVDPELKDTILHRAGYIIHEAVYRAVEKNVKPEVKEILVNELVKRGIDRHIKVK